MCMTKKDIKEILEISKEKLREGSLSEYYSVFNDNINALISGIVEYRKIKGLFCGWGDVINIIGEIFNKEPKKGINVVIKEEILRLVPKNFSFYNFSLVRIMNNE